MWSVVVTLPSVQAEFAATRGAASLAFTFAMAGFGLGGVVTGKISDRYGIVAAIGTSAVLMAVGYVASAFSTALWQIILLHFVIGIGSSATFGPLMAEASHWFERRRGLAVTIAATGNYLGGTLWPPVISWGVLNYDWRQTHIGIGIFCLIAMMLVLAVLRWQMGANVRRVHAAAGLAPD